MYSVFNIKRLETYGFAEADLLSRKTMLKTDRRSLLRGKLNALSKKPFEKWHRQSPISVNLCNLWLKYGQSIMTFYAKQTQFYEKFSVCKLWYIKGIRRCTPHFWPKNPKPNFTRCPNELKSLYINELRTTNNELFWEKRTQNKPNTKPNQTQSVVNSTMAGKSLLFPQIQLLYGLLRSP